MIARRTNTPPPAPPVPVVSTTPTAAFVSRGKVFAFFPVTA